MSLQNTTDFLQRFDSCVCIDRELVRLNISAECINVVNKWTLDIQLPVVYYFETKADLHYLKLAVDTHNMAGIEFRVRE